MKLLTENDTWQVYQSDINNELVVICQTNNDIGSLNMSVKKDSLFRLIQVLHDVYFSQERC
jgi:hypothetical protein